MKKFKPIWVLRCAWIFCIPLLYIGVRINNESQRFSKYEDVLKDCKLVEAEFKEVDKDGHNLYSFIDEQGKECVISTEDSDKVERIPLYARVNEGKDEVYYTQAKQILADKREQIDDLRKSWLLRTLGLIFTIVLAEIWYQKAQARFSQVS